MPVVSNTPFAGSVSHVRARYPNDLRKHLEQQGANKNGVVNIAFLVDVSGSMSCTIQAVKQTVIDVVLSLRPGSQVAVVAYSDVLDKWICKVVSDFTGVENHRELRDKVSELSVLGGSDAAEAQYTAFATLLAGLEWPKDGGRLVVHLTDAAPHTLMAELKGSSRLRNKEQKLFENNPEFQRCGLTYDLTNMADNFKANNIFVVNLVIGYGFEVPPEVQHAYLLMAVRTQFPGFFCVKNSTDSIARQILMVVTWVNQAGQNETLDVQQGVTMIVPDANTKFDLQTCRDDHQTAECKSSALSDSYQISALLTDAFANLIRNDGTVKRFLKKEWSPEEYEARLRSSAKSLQCVLAGVLSETPGSGPECALTLTTLREAVQAFVDASDFGVDDKDLKRLFLTMSSLVFGHPMALPHTGGKFNFEDAWDLHFKSVKGSHFVNNQAFLDYYAATKGDWKVGSLEEIKAVDDIFRQGQNTGVLPCTDGSALADAVIAALAQTPWLEALTWHSVCHHALAVPSAVPGTLSCALRCVLAQAVSTKFQNHGVVHSVGVAPGAYSALDFLSTNQKTLFWNLVRTLWLLPRACSPLRKGLQDLFAEDDGKMEDDEPDARSLLAVQNEGASLTKLLCVLAQNYSDHSTETLSCTEKGRKLALALLGELLADRNEKTDDSDRRAQFFKLLRNPVVDLTDTEKLTHQRHPLEMEDGELPSVVFPVEACVQDPKLARALTMTLTTLEVAGFTSVLDAQAAPPGGPRPQVQAVGWTELTSVWLETLLLGDRSSRGRVEVCRAEQDAGEEKEAETPQQLKKVFSTLQPVPTTVDQAFRNLKHYLRQALTMENKDRLLELNLLRRQALVRTTAVPAVVQSVADGDVSGLADCLNRNWTSFLVPEGVCLGMHNTPAIFQALVERKLKLDSELFVTFVCGRSGLKAQTFWGAGKMFTDVVQVEKFCHLLVNANEQATVLKVVTQLLDSKPPGSSPSVPGSWRFNTRACGLAEQVRGLLGLGPLTSEWELTQALLDEAKARLGPSQNLLPFASLVSEHGTALFLVTSRGQTILWRLGMFERNETTNEQGFRRYSWPDELVAIQREWHVRTFFNLAEYKRDLAYLRTVPAGTEVRGWQLPQAEVDACVAAFLKHPAKQVVADLTPAPAG
eukprot:CAMPEP_0175089074 /NCGR_PEP_ID=MMETSP0086_2-20121207/593_1 /TAXON_ID=136419 /ORGANISM="Unknown Unknown, Strain D1" /LENGTH=1146 /DNA_ID=CAMNT_0016361561 /DNA_START=53 /DNA_END=3493 /DNA_ORIENTATION=-